MWRASFEHGAGVTDPHPLAEQIAYFDQTVLPTHRVRVAKLDARIVGFLASNKESVSQLYVRVANIGQGIASKLIRLAQRDSSGSLWLYTFTRNARACGFYEHHGFIAVARGYEPNWRLEDVKYQWVRSASAA